MGWLVRVSIDIEGVGLVCCVCVVCCGVLE